MDRVFKDFMTGPDIANIRRALFLSQLEMASVLLIPIQDLIALENSNEIIPEELGSKVLDLSALCRKYAKLIAQDAIAFSDVPEKFIVVVAYDNAAIAHMMHAEIPFASFYDSAIHDARSLVFHSLKSEKIPEFHVVRLTESGMDEYFMFLNSNQLSDSTKNRYKWAYAVFSRLCFDA